MLAPMAALLIGCLSGSAITSQGETAAGWWLNVVVGAIMSLLVAAGLGSAVLALVMERKRKTEEVETSRMAALALVLNIVVTTFYVAGFAMWWTMQG